MDKVVVSIEKDCEMAVPSRQIWGIIPKWYETCKKEKQEDRREREAQKINEITLLHLALAS